MILQWLLGKRDVDPSENLYGAIVAAARQEKFHADWSVPDTLDGRFDMLVLHMVLVLDRLHALGKPAETLAQALTDRFFADMDAALREVGVGDLTVGKKVRKMAEAFYGRAAAYRKALAAGDEAALTQAIARNIYAGSSETGSAPLAAWARNAHTLLADQALADMAEGRVRFV
jgi:cytochrome b pre-mRNA-processing protein 3